MLQHPIWSGCLMLATIVPGTPIHRAYAIDSKLAAAVPDDALVAIFVDPTRTVNHGRSMIEIAALAVERVRRMGLLSGLDSDTSLILDTILTWPVVARQPLALVLTSIEAEPYGQGHRLSGMQLSLLLHTKGENGHLTAAIQQFLNRYTNATVSKVEPVASATSGRYRLIDSRLPHWAVVEWGPVGDYYLISLGQGAFDRLCGSIQGGPSLLGEDKKFSEAFRALDGARASALWHIDFSGVRRALTSVMEELPQRVLEALELAEVDRAVWALAMEDRAVRFESFRHVGNTGERVPIALPATETELSDGVVPAGADRYALIRWRPKSLALRVRDAYLRARSPSARTRLRESWSELEQELGISIERDLLHQLGDRLLVHTYPRHPLGLSALGTIQIEITGSAALVRSTIDKLMRRWRSHMAGGRTNGDRQGFPSLLRRADDGLWYLRFGFYGPALMVHDRWIVISFSPQAVRQNLARFAGPTAPGPSPETRP